MTAAPCVVLGNVTPGLMFAWACSEGDLRRVQRWHARTATEETHMCHDYPFREACRRGQASVAQWLWAQGGVNVHAEANDALRSAVARGHLHVARWLLSLDPDADADADAWPADAVRALQSWCPARDAWMRSVVTIPCAERTTHHTRNGQRQGRPRQVQRRLGRAVRAPRLDGADGVSERRGATQLPFGQ